MDKDKEARTAPKPAPKAEPEEDGLEAPTSNDVGEQTATKADAAEAEEK